MHKVLKAFPCSFDGIRSEQLVPDDEREFGSMAEGLKKAGLIGDLGAPPSIGSVTLRDDGPTIVQYVAAGYPATSYPPQGYAARSTPEEIVAAVESEAVKAKAEADAKAKADAKDGDEAAKAAAALRFDLMKLTVAQLREKAAEAKVEVADGAKKDDFIDALIVAAVAPQS